MQKPIPLTHEEKSFDVLGDGEVTFMVTANQ